MTKTHCFRATCAGVSHRYTQTEQDFTYVVRLCGKCGGYSKTLIAIAGRTGKRGQDASELQRVLGATDYYLS